MALFRRLSQPVFRTYAAFMTFIPPITEFSLDLNGRFFRCRDQKQDFFTRIFSKFFKGSFQASLVALVASTALPMGAANAHEFWLQPEQYVVAPGDAAQATIRVGQDFKGNSYSFNPNDFERFELLTAGELTPVAGKLGDRPALNVDDPAEGLLIGVHQSDLERLTYKEFEKFAAFARMEGEDEVIEAHRARDLPASGFEEVYRRFAKTYLKIGDVSLDDGGQDKPVGMALELVALANPYEAGRADVPFQLLRDGEPEADAQVAVWSRVFGATDEAGNVPEGERVLLRTDSDGRVVIPTVAGREYLASAVLIEEPGAEELAERADAVWYSLWASATWLATN